VAWREHLIATTSRFVESGLADHKFVTELTSGDDQKLWSCLSEALVAARVADLNPVPRGQGRGPDFLINGPKGRIWIEVVCPGPGDLPKSWTEQTFGVARSVPHEAILLRWTSAIKAKAEALLGSADGASPGYLAAKVVAPEDAYVIAVNGCRLRGGVFSQFEGISQYPNAVEAVFPVGPMQITINRDSLEVVDRGHQFRPYIIKTSGAHVPADTFLDPRFSPISAVWALDLNGESVFGNREALAVVHNPLARVSLPIGLLPGDAEYVAEPGEDEYVLKNIKQPPAYGA
jgi:hypothetical protein